MSRLELKSYKDMSPAAVRGWLLRSFVVASVFAVAIVVIATSNLGPNIKAPGGLQTANVNSAQ